MKEVPVLSLKKALDMLEVIAFEDLERRGLALSALAGKLGIAPNTARNLLKTMIICGFVTQDETGRYLPGIKCRQLGEAAGRQQLSRIAIPLLEKLGAALGEVVMLAVLSGGRRAVIAQVEPRRSIRADPAALASSGLYEFATGRVLAACSTREELTQVLSRNGLPGSAWDGMNNEKKLLAALGQIRDDGECVIEKHGDSLVAFAVPVRDADGGLVGSLGCYAPAFRCPKTEWRKILGLMHKTAGAISTELTAG